MNLLSIEVTAHEAENVGGCATGCGKPATRHVVASSGGIRCSTFACQLHIGDGEVKALHMLVDALDRQLAELRRHDRRQMAGGTARRV